MPWTRESPQASSPCPTRSEEGRPGRAAGFEWSPVATSIVVPMKDEASRVADLVERITEALRGRGETFEIVLVDDGSSDGTGERMERAASKSPWVRGIARDQNRGKGAAVRAGMLAAKGERRVFLDADLSTDLTGLGGMLESLDAGADFVFGDRRHPDSELLRRQPRWREWLGRAFRRCAHRLSGLGRSMSPNRTGAPGPRDLTCGFKGFRAEAAELVFARTQVDRWAFDAELFTIADELELVAEPVPVRWSHRGPSRVRLPGDALRALVDLLRIARYRRRGCYAADAPGRTARVSLRDS